MVTVVSLSHGKNEAKWLPRCLKSISEQTLTPHKIIYVDDCSLDGSALIAEDYGVVFRMTKPRDYNVLDHVHISEVYNKMFTVLKLCEAACQFKADYIFIGGCDAVYPPTYLEQLIQQMQSDQKLVVASGVFRDEPCGSRYARGLGRVYNAKFYWKYVDSVPAIADWETYPLRKAWDYGFRVQSFPELTYDGRPTGERR